ncbi:MAG TPA: tetratricopeptide repeat protein [Rhodocyclaceae bacterium]|nr:tetratricopeptide repeat protein [Rhodocyclaceae bacterium]
MSLINDMLRDLDSRNAASNERSGLTHNIRALPPQAERRMHPLVLILLAATAGGAVVWLLQKTAAPSEIAPAAAVTATVTAPPLPETHPAPLVEEAPPAAAAAIETPPLRLDTQLEQSSSLPQAAPVVPSPPATPAVTPAPTPSAPKPSFQPQAPVAQTSPRTPDPASRSMATPQISKQPVLGNTPAEQAESEYRRGIAAIRRGDSGEAGAALRAALRLSPAHIGAREALLGQFTEQQRWHDAETLALDGVGLLPQRSDWALLAARLMYERGEIELALETLNQHAAAARQNADYQIMHALLLQRAGRHADAANCYRTALALRPGEGRWWFGLGRALDADRREAEARQAYEKARDSGNLPPELQQSVERRLRQA